ncbi:MAG: GNAT family N-acetyltransferase [Lachnospiraceae bacterium]|nr:GNAT family N-acetyltransferase [Lachnospiraceae bacterium]
MKIRKLQGKERSDAWEISAYCFHQRVDDPEAEKKKVIENDAKERETLDDWGAFTDDGKLTARIINNYLDFYIDGSVQKGGGIGAVSTLPEYRNMGAVREMFGEILRDAYRRGEVISALFPFSHAFYRKQGYETVVFAHNYELTPMLLSGYKLRDDVTMWRPGDSVEGYLEVFTEFAKDFNLSTPRDGKRMEEHLKTGGLFKDRKFSYLIRHEGRPVAYLIFTDVAGADGATLRVDECAWTCREGFHDILGFLARFDADYAKIKILLPQGIDLFRVVRTRQMYEFSAVTHHGFMVRPVNAEAMLKAMKKPDDCDLVIGITDELIAENNAVWRVRPDGAEKLDDLKTPGIPVSYEGLSASTGTPAMQSNCDIVMPSRLFGQMAVGAISFDEALLLGELSVNSKEEMLRRLFTEKKIFVSERF